jgi:hypothetical protein
VEHAGTDGVASEQMPHSIQAHSRAAAGCERMCLWKVQCTLLHPVTQDLVNIEIDSPGLFNAVIQEHCRTLENV